MGDPTRLRQVLGNLLSNAVKFTTEGQVTLRVRRRGRRDAVFEVRDTGIGFAPTEADRLFDRFVQADGSITRSFGGSGLGLSICRELVEMMGGQISADRRAGQGRGLLPRAAWLPSPSTAPADSRRRRFGPRRSGVLDQRPVSVANPAPNGSPRRHRHARGAPTYG